MRQKDTADVVASAAAVVADALGIFAGFMIAVWLRFDSGLIPLFHDFPPPRLYFIYARGAIVATIVILFIFKALRLYIRPQTGSFGDRIPRLVRAVLLGILAATALGFAIRTEPPFSRIVVLLAFPAILICVLAERALLFRWEIHMARRHAGNNRVLILGANAVAGRLRQALLNEPRLRSNVVGFVRMDGEPLHPSIPPEMVLGGPDQLKDLIENGPVDQVILAAPGLPHNRILELLLLCERSLVTFNVVPDIFQVLTGGVEMDMIADIPLLGVGRWPLDNFWNRAVKRACDIVGSALGLLVMAIPFCLIALLIKRDSPGPVFYLQERCGEGGRPFTLVKFRTMRVDAECDGPGWTCRDDPRCTRLGRFLRAWNLDELPQLWNVFKGEMSMVGPRPERPVFVEQFKEDIQGYMWRHVTRPGMTGWAQVNGFRGDSDLRERINYDLYYLENWSLAFDFKILVKTLFARKNAY